MICKILSNYFQSWQIYWQNKKGISSQTHAVVGSVPASTGGMNIDNRGGGSQFIPATIAFQPQNFMPLGSPTSYNQSSSVPPVLEIKVSPIIVSLGHYYTVQLSQHDTITGLKESVWHFYVHNGVHHYNNRVSIIMWLYMGECQVTSDLLVYWTPLCTLMVSYVSMCGHWTPSLSILVSLLN